MLNRWFSEYHASLTNELFPRDFMWYNERIGAQEWFYALPAGAKETDCGGFEIVDLPSGLFAVASCMDADFDRAEDWLNTRENCMQRRYLLRIYICLLKEGDISNGKEIIRNVFGRTVAVIPYLFNRASILLGTMVF